MTAKGNAQQAEIEAILGSTGCGKTTHLRTRLAAKKPNRTIIWSPKEAVDNYAAFYPGTVTVRSANEVLAALKQAGKSGGFHLVYVPRLNRKLDEQQFNVVAKLALAAGNLTFIVDELHTVTKPSWAPDGWSELNMMGRGFGVKIFALSQRPASCDKDFLGSVSTLHVRRLSYPEDAVAAAKALGVPASDVSALNGFAYIERDMNAGRIVYSDKKTTLAAKKIAKKRAA